MLIRVLLRAALLAGLVICGWLFGSATALAAEDTPHPAHPAVALDALDSPNSPDTVSDQPAPTRIAPVRIDGLLRGVLPGTETPQPPAAPSAVSGLVSRVVQPIVQPVVQLVVRPVLGPVSPIPAIQPPPLHLTAPPAQATTEPAVPTAAPIPVPAAPLPWVAVAAPVTTPLIPHHAAAAGSVNRFATMPAVHRVAVHDDRSGAPRVPVAPPGPLNTPSTSCPAGPAGQDSVAQGAPASLLPDTAPSADVRPLEQALQARTGGLPRWLSQRPSTSPD